jgi:hypothetical protein
MIAAAKLIFILMRSKTDSEESASRFLFIRSFCYAPEMVEKH